MKSLMTRPCSLQQMLTMMSVRRSRAFSVIVLVVTLVACGPAKKTTPSTHALHEMGEFTTNAGVEFLTAINGLDTISELSIFDCRRELGEYELNRNGWIFSDTLQMERPKHVSYVTASRELGIQPSAMWGLLRAFDRMKVNAYRRMEGYHLFRVRSYIGVEEGYVFIPGPRPALGSSLTYISIRLVLMRDLGDGWYEVKGRC